MTTLLSTRHLIADPNKGGSAVLLSSATKEAGRSAESRRITSDAVCPSTPPTLIGPGDATGEPEVANPVRFRWTAVPNAAGYRVIYSAGGKGSGKDVELGQSTGTELIGTVPAGPIKWRVLAVGSDNSCKGATSQSFEFTAFAPCDAPAIDSASSDVSITAGQTATFSITASGNAPLSYAWYEGEAGTRTKPVGTSSPSFTSPQLFGDTSYWVEVKSSGCVTRVASRTFRANVCTPAAITAQPQNQTVTEGQPAMLTVTGAGTAPLTYQWFRGATQVGNNSSSYNTGALTQTTTYRVVITNACGSATSNDVTVTVAPKCDAPTIAAQPQPVSINDGQSATLSVTANGTAPLTYQWYRGTTPVGTNSNTFNTGALTQTTTYRVVITNACGTVTSNDVTVTVTPNCNAPSIATQPQPVSINDGQSATLTVTANGTAPLTYQWYRGTTPVGTNSSSFNTGALTQTTSYRVVITNACGTAISNDVTVTVTPSCNAPSIATQPQPVSINDGQSATLSVTANGTAPLTYQWYRGTAPVGTNSSTFSTGALTQTTTYRVVITNACGTVTSNDVTVTVTSACVAPTITAQPAAQTVEASTKASVSIVATGTQPLTYQWYEGPRGNRSHPVGTNSATYVSGRLTESTQYWVEVRNACGVASSDAAAIQIAQNPIACRVMPAAPRVLAAAVATSGVHYNIRWDAVENATEYEIDEAADDTFTNAITRRTTALRESFEHVTDSPRSFFYRVRALNACDGSKTAYSRVVRMAVVPHRNTSSTDLVAPFGTREVLVATVTAKMPDGAVSFTAQASEPWLTVNPPSGGMPASGEVTFTITADPSALPNGTSTASLSVTTTGDASRGIASQGTKSLGIPISVSLVTPVLPATPRDGGEVWIIPAVAHADGNNSRWQSDVRISHTYDSLVRYALTFTPSGASTPGQQTEIAVASGETIALDDILGRWFGAGMATSGSTGVLEVRTLDAAAGAGRTLATSRLFNAAESGSFGQFIAAVPLAKFISSSNARQTLVALSESARYRTNIGLVEATGNPARVLLEVFNGTGTKVLDTFLDLKAGEHRQIGSMLNAAQVDMSNARIDVSLVSGSGKVSSYASVIDNTTGDPSFVPAVEVSAPRAQRYTIAGVANMPTATGRWQSDVRLHNAGLANATARIEFFREGQSAPAARRDVEIAAGEVLVFDDVLQSAFEVTGAGGALRITTPTDSTLVPAARTYHNNAAGTYGQFIAAATDENTAALGTPALRIQQTEESPRFRTNIGLTEVSGSGATVEVTAALPNRKITAVTTVELQPNEFRQLNRLLQSMGFTDAYNATIDVRVISGDGRVVAYGSVVDNRTQDPTYVMAQ